MGKRSPLSYFENSKKVPWFCKIVPWFWKKGALFVCICGLNFHLKCTFKSILEKKHQFFALRGLSIVCHTWNVYRIALIPRNLPCHKKIPDCMPGLYSIKVLQEVALYIIYIYVCVEILVVNWKRSRISRIDQERIMLNFHKFSFLALEFPRGVTQYHGNCKGKASFCPKFP